MSQFITTIILFSITALMAAEPVKEVPATVVAIILESDDVKREFGNTAVFKIEQTSRKKFKVIDAKGCSVEVKLNRRHTKVRRVGDLDCSFPELIQCYQSSTEMVNKDGSCIRTLDSCHQAELRAQGYIVDRVGLCGISASN